MDLVIAAALFIAAIVFFASGVATRKTTFAFCAACLFLIQGWLIYAEPITYGAENETVVYKYDSAVWNCTELLNFSFNRTTYHYEPPEWGNPPMWYESQNWTQNGTIIKNCSEWLLANTTTTYAQKTLDATLNSAFALIEVLVGLFLLFACAIDWNNARATGAKEGDAD